ncbi:hypothetical protein WHR41_09653 [Cladosporium halotolerans]|uniref:BZIP domain-containing protein n=1 Tax=Cladosporium halotolerans TaxID=1052096 RepID=A0AB34KFG3_9PEZI
MSEQQQQQQQHWDSFPSWEELAATPRHSSQSTTVSQRSDEGEQALQQSFAMGAGAGGIGEAERLISASGVGAGGTEGLQTLCPVDSAMPAATQELKAAAALPASDSARQGQAGAREGEGEGEGAEEPEGAGTPGVAFRRARNRTAASKCRAKQKLQAKALQKEFDEGSARNARLRQQALELRGLVVSLRDYALQHDSSRCRCTSLHAFNKKRAERYFQSVGSSSSSPSSCSI